MRTDTAPCAESEKIVAGKVTWGAGRTGLHAERAHFGAGNNGKKGCWKG
ncbi:hypothetical protein CHISP_0659 [Chitinispirillum alkaliphilum]|nr:hypothetical protein CHISP_0659 [Chitinispirillum alkaliphilum]